MSSKQTERRRALRREILATFSLFIAVPQKGPYRLKVHDLSELGIGFDLDMEEDAEPFPISLGEVLEIQFYLNQSLFIPLQVKVLRIEEKGGVRRIGAEFEDRVSAGYNGLLSFLKLLDTLAELPQGL